jgi:hypothetical protein
LWASCSYYFNFACFALFWTSARWAAYRGVLNLAQ